MSHAVGLSRLGSSNYQSVSEFIRGMLPMTTLAERALQFDREHARSLRALAYRMLGSRSDAEGIVQESWLQWARYSPALRAAGDALGADRILLGTDFPYESGALFQRAVDYIGESGLPAESAALVLDFNAARTLQLPPASS